MYFPDLLFDHLHLFFHRHASNTQGTSQLRSALIFQQFTVVLNYSMSLPRQLPLQTETRFLQAVWCITSSEMS